MKGNRIYAYDLLKTIAIYLVCLYHYGTIDFSINNNTSTLFSSYFNYFVSAISSIAVPVFFMVNGALLLNKNYNLKQHIFKILSLAVLFIFWSALTLGIVAFKNSTHYAITEFIQTIYRLKSEGIKHLWFLQAIIYIYLMFPLIKAVYDNNDTRLTAYVLVLIFLFTFGIVLLQDAANMVGYFLNNTLLKTLLFQPFSWLNPFSVYFSYALVYFIIGGWIAKNINTINIKSATAILLLFLFWLLLFFFGLMETKITGVLYDTVYKGYNSIMTFIMTICMFVLCMKRSFSSEHLKKIIAIVGSNTLGIYLIHAPVGVLLTGYYYSMPLSKYLLTDLLYAFFVMVVSLILTLLIKKIPLAKKLVEI